MSITAEQFSDILYKNLIARKGSTSPTKEYFLEEEISNPDVYIDQVWLDAGEIPAAHGLTVNDEIYTSGSLNILQYKVDAVLNIIPGTLSFKLDGLDKVISPFVYGLDYKYIFKNDLNESFNIYDTNYDGIFDSSSGILTFYNTLPPNITTTVKITCVQYIGRTGMNLVDFLNSEGQDLFTTVESIIDSTEETAILLTTGSVNERYLILDDLSANDKDILYWDIVGTQWAYKDHTTLKEGYTVWPDDELNSIRRLESNEWIQISFGRDTPSIDNKNIQALITTEDFQPAFTVGITGTPVTGSYVGININGASYRVANGYNPATTLDLDSKMFDCIISKVQTNAYSASTGSTNEAVVSPGDYTSFTPVVGDLVWIRDTGLTEYVRTITAVNGTDTITYDGTDVPTLDTIDRVDVRASGTALPGDIVRWKASAATFHLSTSDYIDVEYVTG